MAQIQAIDVDDKGNTVHVRFDDGTGKLFHGTLAEFHGFVSGRSVAQDDWGQIATVLDEKLKVDPTLKDTTDIVAKPLDYKPPVVVKPAELDAEVRK